MTAIAIRAKLSLMRIEMAGRAIGARQSEILDIVAIAATEAGMPSV